MSNINIRIDNETKTQAEALFAELGLNMSSAINIFLKASLRSQGLPFEIKLDIPNAETTSAIKEAEEMMRTGKGKKYKNVECLKETLDV